jgi:lipoprotein-releasing system ATP-binding protein
MSEHEVHLELEGVSKRYAGAEGAPELSILREIRLTLRRGESLSIVGPSGSGKTTLLNLIGTLDRPDSGRVLLQGEDLARLGDEALARVRNQRMGFVFQFHHLLPHLSVWENVLVPTLAFPVASEAGASRERASRLLERVGLGARVGHRPGQLSGGERQRVALVRALVNQPQLLLADEPTGSLDQRSAQELGSLLVDLNREEGVTLVVVTHSTPLAAAMQRTVALRDGALVEGAR